MAQVRRVRRIIRKFDPWTVFKVSAVFWGVAGLALVLGSVMFWSILDASGIPQRLTDTLVQVTLLDQGADPFGDPDRFLRVAIFGSIVLAVTATGFTTLAAVMYNLVSDVVGGVEFVVLEETLTQPAPRAPYQAPARATTNGGTGNGTSSVDMPTQETPVIAGR